MSNTYCVYIHKNKTNGKQYCGITCQKPEYRWRDGNGYLHNAHFQNAISKYGWDGFEHIITHDNLSHQEANRIEQEYIAKFNLTNPDLGYNQTDGGDGTLGYTHSDETKQRMSISRTGHITTEDTRQKISKKNSGQSNGMYKATPWNKGQPMSQEVRDKVSRNRKGKHTGESHHFYGKKHSEESIKKMSESHKGHIPWNKGIKTGVIPRNARKVGMFNDDGALLNEYQSLTDAAKSVNGCTQNIIACCRGRVKHAFGYAWRYLEEKEVI